MATTKKSVALALLAVCAAAAAAFPAPARAARAEGTAQTGLPWLPAVPPAVGGTDPEIVRCVKSLVDANNCVDGIMEAAHSGKMNITEGCCLAIDAMSEHCLATIFPVPLFGSVFVRLVKSFCAAMPPPSA